MKFIFDVIPSLLVVQYFYFVNYSFFSVFMLYLYLKKQNLATFFLENSTCRKGQFQCGNKKCIPALWKCDHENDCIDGSDEKGCVSNNKTCLSNKLLRCDDGKCIDIRWRCDGENDCY